MSYESGSRTPPVLSAEWHTVWFYSVRFQNAARRKPPWGEGQKEFPHVKKKDGDKPVYNGPIKRLSAPVKNKLTNPLTSWML